MLTVDAGLVEAVKADPGDEATWLVLSDWLEENADPGTGEMLRLTTWLRRTGEEGARPAREAQLQVLLASGVPPFVPTTSVPLDHGVELVLALIPPGTFWMGSPLGESGRLTDEGPRHPVTLTRAFWLGVYPVTQAQWRAVTRKNPARFKGDDHPVERTSWVDCTAFCRKLSEKTGKKFRLPTEAEWEYACRAGTTTPFYAGSTAKDLERLGWCSFDRRWGSAGQTRPVSSYAPNAWGLFDMHGNVWEWCLDWFDHDYYASSPSADPTGGRGATDRILRGGAWFSIPDHCRCACRGRNRPDMRDDMIGCRVVMEAG